MSGRNIFTALQEIRSWNVDTVVRALEKNGLGDCASAVRKRGITGDSLLDLTEIKLTTWKRDLGVSNVRKFSTFVQDLSKDPARYLMTGEVIHEVSTELSPDIDEEIPNPASLKGLLPARSGSSSSHSSWGSDFDEDPEDSPSGKQENGSKKGNINNVADWTSGSVRSHNEVSSSAKSAHASPNTQQKIHHPVTKLTIPAVFASRPEVPASKPKVTLPPGYFKSPGGQQRSFKSDEKPAYPSIRHELSEVKKAHTNNPATFPRPSVPIRPPALTSKPAAPQDKSQLPKPPTDIQGTGTVQNLISNLKFECGDEYYDTFDGEPYPDVKKSSPVSQIKSHVLNLPFPPTGPTPPQVPQNKNIEIRIPLPSQFVTSSQQEPYQEEEYEVCEDRVPSENGYESEEEYESIKEHVTNLPRDGPECSDYYLQPVTKPGQPQPVLPPVPTINQEPAEKAPPLPAKPRSLLPDVVISPTLRPPSPSKPKSEDSGSSGDGVTGRIGGLFRKRREVKEKTPTPEIKKTVTPPVPTHKPPPPPPVEQRPAPPVSSTQGRPLPQPPTSDSSHRSSEKSVTTSHRKTDGHPPLTSMPWYHNVDRRKGEAMLRNGKDGAFMIRPSTQVKNSQTLTLWYNGRMYNISVRLRPDARYALGSEKANEQSFPTIEELVVNYQSEKLLLYSGGEQTGKTLLTTTPKKETSK